MFEKNLRQTISFKNINITKIFCEDPFDIYIGPGNFRVRLVNVTAKSYIAKRMPLASFQSFKKNKVGLIQFTASKCINHISSDQGNLVYLAHFVFPGTEQNDIITGVNPMAYTNNGALKKHNLVIFFKKYRAERAQKQTI